VDAAGQCSEANAQRLQVEQLRTDPEAVASILNGTNAQEFLVTCLNFGNDRDVSDELFFEALKIHGSIIFSLPFAKQKMARGQAEKRSTDKKIKSDAKDNLIKIGTVLAETGHERNNAPFGYIAIVWQQYYNRQLLYSL
jgi:hypothetical protein